VKVGHSTVAEVLKRSGVYPYYSSPKPLLTPAHKLKRLQWATAHVNDPIAVTMRRVFADEKRFAVCGGRFHLWRYPWEARPIRRVAKFPVNVLVSGVITCNGVSSLIMYEPKAKFTGTVYRETLKRNHIPLTRRIMRNQPFTFIHDHASQHDSKVVDDWLATQDFGRDETFPPNSPDLNLIENVWGMMVQGMAPDSIENLEDLTRSIKRQWEEISPPCYSACGSITSSDRRL